MAERRYNDKEIAAIFRAATEGPHGPHPDVPAEEGLTVAELQAIGGEVGILPEAVARAAQALDIRQASAARTLLGLPIGVARTVNLNRRLTDHEWERLVVRLRGVFNARGRTGSVLTSGAGSHNLGRESFHDQQSHFDRPARQGPGDALDAERPDRGPRLRHAALAARPSGPGLRSWG